MIRYESIPETLKRAGKFCLWAYENRGGKLTKVPYSPSGAKARTNARNTFGTYEEAVKALENRGEKFSGIGIGVFDDLVCIDIDHCMVDGEISPMAKEIIERVNSYAEISPSGNGVHIICNARGLAYSPERYLINNRQLGLEIYVAGATNRFLTITGKTLNCENVNNRKSEIEEILEKYMLRNTSQSTNELTACGSVEATYEVRSDEKVIDLMRSSKNGDRIARLMSGDYEDDYDSHSEADMALCNHLAYWTENDIKQMDRIFRSSGLMRDKWDRRQAGTTYGQITLKRAIQGCAAIRTAENQFGKTEDIEKAVKFLESVDAVHNPRYAKDDIGAGDLLADYIKPFARPLAKGKTWMTYDGKHWSDAAGGAVVEEAAKSLGRAIAVYATHLPNEDFKEWLSWAEKWTQRAKRKQYIQDAVSEYTVSRGDFDRDPWLFNLSNGTLDLRTMELRPHDPNDLITQISPVIYDPNAKCERWESFIDEIMVPGECESGANDKQLIRDEKAEFLQRYCGYCLSGDTRAEAFLVMYGPTSRNGKSVCVETVQAIMGTYSKAVNADTLMQVGKRDGSGPSEDIARLVGVRMANVGEIRQGARLDAARVKLLTGGDTVNARFLGENSFDFAPQFKLVLHTNHLPQCSDLSVFDSQRALVLPFSRHFAPDEQDHRLKDYFKEPENQSGILNWLLQGLKAYRESGLNPPTAVINATKEYRKDSDKIMRFAEECLIPDPKEELRTAFIYEKYKTWCISNGVCSESSQRFKQGLERIGIEIVRARPKNSPGSMTTLIRGYALSDE